MIAFIVVRMMDAQTIAQLSLSAPAQLAGVVVARSYLGFQRLTKARRILPVGYAALPHGITFATKGMGDPEQPVLILGHRNAPNARLLSTFRCPPFGNLLPDLWPLPSFQPGLGSTCQQLTQRSFLFWRSHVTSPSHARGTLLRAILWRSRVCVVARSALWRLAVHWLPTFRARFVLSHSREIIP